MFKRRSLSQRLITSRSVAIQARRAWVGFGVSASSRKLRRGMRAAWLRLVVILAVLAAGHVLAAGATMADSGLPRPRRRLACTSWRTRTWTRAGGTRSSIRHRQRERYPQERGAGVRADPARCFTFGDAAFLVRWLRAREARHRPRTASPRRRPRGRDLAAPRLELFRSSSATGADVVGGGWVSTTRRSASPPGAACSTRESSRESRRRGRRLEADGGVADRPARARGVHPGGTGAPGYKCRGNRETGRGGGSARAVGVCLTSRVKPGRRRHCFGGTITCRARWTSRRSHRRGLGRRRGRARGGGGGVA